LPSRRVHNLVDKALLGRSYDSVHRAIDQPYKYLGKRHRILFHDPLTATLASGGKPAPATLHILLDNICSKDRRLGELLELLARLKG